ncbi:MAG: serine hydrolase domain-containing protein [Bacteroidota bacterium]
MRILRLTFFFILFFPLTFFAQDAKTIAKIDKYMTQLYNAGCFNGNILLADSNQIIYEKSFGYADYKKKEMLDANCRFEIASLTKAFTAIAILQLKDKSKLLLSDSINKFIPDFPYHGITIRHLLNHTSGLPDYVGLFFNYFNQQKLATNQDIVTMLIRYKPKLLNAPGSAWKYSNTGYCMLALTIEKISGMSYADYIQKYIFDACDLRQSYLFSDKGYADKFFLAKPYFYSYKYKATLTTDSMSQAKLIKAMAGITGDARIFSTTGDLYKFNKNLFSGNLISSESLREAISTVQIEKAKTPAYGMGWYLDKETSKQDWIYHPGIFPGYRAYWGKDLKKGTFLILLGNNEQVNDKITVYADNILRILKGKKPRKIKENAEGIHLLMLK